MAVTKTLSRIERELVLQYLKDDNVPLTITLENRPDASESEFSGDNTTSESDDRVPTSALFPVAIPSEQMTVLDQGIILLKRSIRVIAPFLGQKVKVQFYFNHLGLFFVTEMKEYSKGLALVIPSEIFRIEESVTTIDWSIRSTISYGVNGSTVEIPCVPENNFVLFQEPKWGLVQNQKKAKSYLEKFVAEARNEMGNSIGNGIHLISVARYLTDIAKNDENPTGKARPFSIIFMDDRRIVVASGDSEQNLQLEQDYQLSMEFTLLKNSMLKRTVNCNIFVENIYENDEETGKCFVCSYTHLKEEDKRYLYERYYGKKVE